jgi:hypothetical protein
MGLWVFLLICGPVTALVYFPLTTRKSLRLAPAGVSQASAGPASPAANKYDVIPWTREADDNHLREWEHAA